MTEHLSRAWYPKFWPTSYKTGSPKRISRKQNYAIFFVSRRSRRDGSRAVAPDTHVSRKATVLTWVAIRVDRCRAYWRRTRHPRILSKTKWPSLALERPRRSHASDLLYLPGPRASRDRSRSEGQRPWFPEHRSVSGRRRSGRGTSTTT